MGQWRRFSAFVTKDSNCAIPIAHSLRFARSFLEDLDCKPRLKIKLVILVEELVTNSLRHGGKSQDLALLLILQGNEDVITVEMVDDGPKFDPFTVAPITGPDPATGGGIGLAIINTWGEDAVYSRASGSNHLKLTLC
ncbi:MAG: ATP-binding protein [Erythrobacter sp.]|uniref:ATP-binding protein n=1 Tax=Erythrobacter sp. TaxID=1042 RepID=UPI003265D98C